MQFYKKEFVNLIYMSDIVLVFLFYTLINTVSSGYSSVILIKNEDVSETPVNTFVAGDEATIKYEFERRVRDVEIVYTKPKENSYKYETYYSPPKFEYPDWNAILEQQRKEREEEERREREEEERDREKLEEELQKRVATYKILTGVGVILTIIIVTICVYISVRYDARQRRRRNNQAVDNVMVGPQLHNRTREFPPVEDHTRIPLRSNIEAYNTHHRNDQEELSNVPIGFLPNFYGDSNNHSSRNLPTANLHDYSNSSSNHDLPLPYNEAVVHLEPTAPPAHNGLTPSSKI